ncbi:hypothetical protein Ddye_007982 [Dipteronia dyeriana]|uniref:Polyprotein n=1 Tax=Dipteronia dyeriana TaxID=168575 RepID=A0AAD9X8N0_9ROSI|nr:hypothetical protein Ddye_007982 [Dipteronia dyeriana]
MVQDLDDSYTPSESTGYTNTDSPSEAYQVTSNESTSPQVQIQVLTTKYSNPVSVIAYFDTGAHSSMMNPKVLPAEAWKEEKNEFLAADGNTCITYLVSKHKVGIQFFPSFTLWTQISYRLQDHALDLPILGHTGDTLFIKAEREDEVPTIIQIPKQLPRDKLTEIMPLNWITNYDKAFQNTTPVIASDTKFTKLPGGSIQTIYEPISTPVPDASAVHHLSSRFS